MRRLVSAAAVVGVMASAVLPPPASAQTLVVPPEPVHLSFSPTNDWRGVEVVGAEAGSTVDVTVEHALPEGPRAGHSILIVGWDDDLEVAIEPEGGEPIDFILVRSGTTVSCAMLPDLSCDAVPEATTEVGRSSARIGLPVKLMWSRTDGDRDLYVRIGAHPSPS